MRPSLVLLPWLSLPLASGAARADIVQCSGGVPPSVICLVGNVSDTAGGGPLVAGKVYHLSGIVTVPLGEVLTVEGGAILKFHPSARLDTLGTLSAGPGAIFTSLPDDAAGGDTNGDGFSVGLPGDWDGLAFFGASDASVLDQAIVRYATSGVRLLSSDALLKQTLVTGCAREALNLTGSSAPTVTGCSFNANDFAVEGAPLRALPGFTGNSASGNTLGDYIHVTDTEMPASLVIQPQNSLGTEPFVVVKIITVPAGLTLDLRPGVTFKFGFGPYPPYPTGNFGGFFVSGTLLLDGVDVTSVDDDSIAGDTKKDGFTEGTPGDWGNFSFQASSDASQVKNSRVRFGGSGTIPFIVPSLFLNAADVLLDGVTVEDGLGDALWLSLNSFPTVQNCAFRRHAGYAVKRVALGAVAGFTANSASENALDALELLGAVVPNVDGTVVIQKHNALNGDGVFAVAGDVTLDPTGVLELGPGVVLKWTVPENHRVTVSGRLDCRKLAGSAIVFTSLRDDEVAGDTNKDGGLTQPAPGDWTGIDFFPGSDASVLDGVVVRYAGQGGATTAAIRLSASGPTLAGSVVERSETAALDLLNFASFPAVSGCSFDDNERAVIKASIRALPGFTGNSAGGNAQGDYLEVTNGDVAFGAAADGGCGLEIGPDNALAPGSTFVLADDIDVPAGCLLSVLGGTLVKWQGNRELDVDGTLQIGSVGGGTAAFTSIDDDSVGGDTRNDGATEGAPGDWVGISISGGISSLEDVLVRFAGSTANAAVELLNANAQLKQVRVQDSAGRGLDLNANSLPVMDGCELDRNTLAADGVPLRALPGFSNNTAADNALGDYLRVTDAAVAAMLLVQPSQSLNGGPIVVADNLDVLLGATLTLAPATVLKFEGNRTANVNGTLLTSGTFGATIFTTLLDDIAGDTNKDGGATVPTPGLWQGFVFGSASDASVLGGARVRYAGSFGLPALSLGSADVQILDTLVELSGGEGLSLQGTSFPQVRRSSFANGAQVVIDLVPLGAVGGFLDNTASGNLLGDYVRVTSGTVSGVTPMRVARHNALNGSGVFVVDASVTVNAGATLELRQGTIFKWQGINRNLTVNGRLVAEGTGLEPVVLTHVNDDAFGGDTKKDGAVPPLRGSWGQLVLNNSAFASSLEHLRARYGGSSQSAILLANGVSTARALRAELSASDGIQASALAGGAVSWVAFDNAGHGFDLTGGAFDVVHGTAAQNGGAGINGSAAHLGGVRNSIAFGNAGGEVLGFAPGEVFSSNAGAAFAGLDGNIAADPLFVSRATGDLALGAGSPSIDTADLLTALGAAKDHVEAARVLDHDLDGAALADMGAFEAAAYTLAFGGQPKVGTLMSFTVAGPPGVSAFALGLLGGTTFLPPYGVTLFGPLGSQLILGSKLVGEPLLLPIPPDPGFVDLAFGVQGLGLPFAPPGAGNLTNLYRGRILP